MKIIVLTLIMQTFTFSSLGFGFSGKWRPIHCSRDRNEWGKPSMCKCQNAKYEYKPEIGKCVENGQWNPEAVSYVGILHTSLRGPGGETTGIGIEMNHSITDLVLKVSDREVLKQYDKHLIFVSGFEVVLPSTEPHGPRGWVAVIVYDYEILSD